mmetsp:Transcript_18473/g.49175  ORF Transcript_18473/g.49175 Transcript_18473/m.49175 type:complete len:97 (+) Transcript_18473:2300-2590(+)
MAQLCKCKDTCRSEMRAEVRQKSICQASKPQHVTFSRVLVQKICTCMMAKTRCMDIRSILIGGLCSLRVRQCSKLCTVLPGCTQSKVVVQDFEHQI